MRCCVEIDLPALEKCVFGKHAVEGADIDEHCSVCMMSDGNEVG